MANTNIFLYKTNSLRFEESIFIIVQSFIILLILCGLYIVINHYVQPQTNDLFKQLKNKNFISTDGRNYSAYYPQ